MSDVQMCEVCDGELAFFAFSWDWGEHGVCGHKGRMLLEQKSKSLKRDVTFVSLGNEQSAPMERSERQNYEARVLAAEAEAESSKQRAGKLAVSLDEAQKDLMRERQVAAGLRAELDSSRKKNEELSESVMKSQAEKGALSDSYEQRLTDLVREKEAVEAKLDAANVLLESQSE